MKHNNIVLPLGLRKFHATENSVVLPNSSRKSTVLIQFPAPVRCLYIQKEWF